MGEVPAPRMVGPMSEAGASPALSRNCKVHQEGSISLNW